MRLLLAVLAVLLSTTACGSEAAPTAQDPAPTGSTDAPQDVPAADGPVRTRDLAFVMDTGTPQLCVGPVAESWPPQCGGPEIVGWDWQDAGRGMYEQEGDVRWGQFALTGTWDGTRFTVTDAIPAALYDPAAAEEPTYPPPSREYSQAELDDIAATVGRDLPGAQGAYAADGRVLVDVVHDDGSLQAYVDGRYGEDVVVVTSALVDAGS